MATRVPTLRTLAARALPEPLRTIHERLGDVHLTSLAAETFADVHAVGRVGRRPSCLTTRALPGGGIRVDCLNHPEFWLELYETAGTYAARGRCEGAAGQFVATTRGNGIRVDHSAELWFWLELRPAAELCYMTENT